MKKKILFLSFFIFIFIINSANARKFGTFDLVDGETGKVKFEIPAGSSDVTLEVEYDGQTKSYQYPRVKSDYSYYRYLRIGQLKAFEEKPIKLKVYYTDMPDNFAQTSMNVVGIPGKSIYFLLKADNEVLDNKGIPISFVLGKRERGSSIKYDPELHGTWKIKFGWIDKDKKFNSLTDEYIYNTKDQVINTTIKNIEPGSIRLIAQASLDVPEEYQQLDFDKVFYSNPVYITVLQSSYPKGDIVSKKLTGPVPFRTVFYFTPDENSKKVFGGIKWELSKDLETWEVIGEERRLALTLDAGHYYVRAHLTNSKTGVAGYSEVIEILAYNRPEIKIIGPKEVLINTPTTLKAEGYVNGEKEDNIDIKWYKDGELISTGSEITLNSEKATSMKLQVEAKVKEYPDEKEAWVRDYYRLSFITPRPLRGKIEGPSYMELNKVEAKTYTLNATITTEIDNTIYTVKGKWVLPDGQIIPDVWSINYSPTEADFQAGKVTFEYHTWIEGYEDTTLNIFKKTVRINKYSWPNFILSWSSRFEFAPSIIRLSVKPEEAFGGRLLDPEYTWHLPADTEILSNYGNTIYAKFNKAGEFDVSVDITDSYGSSSKVVETITLAEPPELVLNITPYFYNKYLREPLDMKLKYQVEGGHPLDDIEALNINVDDPNAEVKVYSTFATIKNLSAGSHTITVEGTSELGLPIKATLPVEVNVNLPPTCEIESKEYDRYVYYTSICKDEDGKVVKYEWLLNGSQVSSLSSRSFSKPVEGQITFRAYDDSDDYFEKTFEVNFK